MTWSLVGNPAGPTIFIFPSMSHSALVTRPRHIRHPSPSIPAPPSASPSPGWWEAVTGWGEAYGIDLTTFNVLSASALGAPFGTSSPLSPDPRTPPGSPSPYRASFPLITPLDQARCHHTLLTHLTTTPGLLPPGYRLSLPLFAVIGSSMGGMAAIHFATSFPSAYQRVVLICTTPLTSPSTQALRSTQRAAVRMDPLYQSGRYTSPPIAGLRLARMMGTICYRSRMEFDARFSSQVGEGGRFPVERYLDHVGWTFGGRYDANCYLLLSEAMDRMDVGQVMGDEKGGQGGGGGRMRVEMEEAVRRVNPTSEWMVLPVTEDALIPAEESDRWASALGEAGVRVHHERVSSKYGHDAFLKEGDKLNPRLSAFLTGREERGERRGECEEVRQRHLRSVRAESVDSALYAQRSPHKHRTRTLSTTSCSPTWHGIIERQPRPQPQHKLPQLPPL